MKLRPLALAAIATVLVAIAVSQLYRPASYPTDGPLPKSPELIVEFGVPDGASATWGMPFPETTRPAVVKNVEVLGLDNLTVAGIGACNGRTLEPDGSYTHCAPINASGWPPADVTIVPLDGLPLGLTPADSPGLLIGATRTDPSRDGTTTGIRIIYVADGVTYSVDQPYMLHLTRPTE